MKSYYFVFRLSDLRQLDLRSPAGGLVVRAWTRRGRLNSVLAKAESRFPCRPGEFLWLVEVKGRIDRQHVKLMDRDWEKSFREFRELMEVPSR